MLILGIDPGLQRTGWGIIEKNGNTIKYTASGIISTTSHVAIARHNDSINLQNNLIQNNLIGRSNIGKRLQTIFDGITTILDKYHPHSTGIENTYVNMNYTSSLKLAQARAIAIVSCSIKNIQILEYQAKTIKKAVTGCGNADKTQIAKMIAIYLGVNICEHDATDAIAIALCHALIGI